MKPQLVILGTGPGALYAFQGALKAGYDWKEVEIWGKDLVYPKGAFWLHWVADLKRSEPEFIELQLLGDAATYSRKQWGDR